MIVPVGTGPEDGPVTVAVNVNVSPSLGAAGEIAKVIVGVCGPTVTLIGVDGYCVTAK